MSDTQRLPTADGTWLVERTEDTERVIDPGGVTRYEGRHSYTAVHFADALRREEEYRRACADALRVLDELKPAAGGLADLRQRLRAVLRAGPEFWQRMDIPGPPAE